MDLVGCFCVETNLCQVNVTLNKSCFSSQYYGMAVKLNRIMENQVLELRLSRPFISVLYIII